MLLSRARSALALGVFVGAAAFASPKPSRASIVVAALFDAVVADSSDAAVVTPVEQRALWENGRIYTYTRVHVDRPVAGSLGAGADAWVRTMGGVVGKVGQVVDGEPTFTVGRPSFVFLHANEATASGTFDVTARAQGQFPVVLGEDQRARLRASAAVGVQLAPNKAALAKVEKLGLRTQSVTGGPALAADVLVDKDVDGAAQVVAASWKRLHGK